MSDAEEAGTPQSATALAGAGFDQARDAGRSKTDERPAAAPGAEEGGDPGADPIAGAGFDRGRSSAPGAPTSAGEADAPASDEPARGAEARRTDPRELIELVYHEARLLDEGRFREWLDLFAEDGCYWVAAEPGQTDPQHPPSPVYEDRRLLRTRVEKLASTLAASGEPPSRSQHLLGAPQVDGIDEVGSGRTYTPFHCVEARTDRQVIHAGWARHEIVRERGALRIRLKRVDLLNFDAPHGSIQLLM